MEPLTIALLTSQREGLRALLLVLPSITEVHRNDVKAGVVMALSAVEDALGMERTLPRRDERRRERLHAVIE